MENKEIKDYLHLYLGCEVMLPDGFINKMVISSDDTHKEISLWLAILTKCKLILRPLSDMTQEEAIEVWRLCHPTDIQTKAYQVIDYYRHNINFYESIEWLFLLSKHFDLFGLIEAGLAIDKTKIN